MAQNEILILIWDMLANLIRKSQSKIYGIPWSPKKALSAHKKIFLALKAKDPRKAVEAMKQHMLDEEKALVAALERGKG
jgi:DNA-binding FadR family transcriptional regulator